MNVKAIPDGVDKTLPLGYKSQFNIKVTNLAVPSPESTVMYQTYNYIALYPPDTIICTPGIELFNW